MVPRAAGVESPGAIGLPPLGRTALFLRARFACTDDEVLRAERKLLPHHVHPGIDPARAGNICDLLQSQLSLSEPELKKVVLRHPAVLNYSYEATIVPSLAALQSRLSLSEPELKKMVLKLPSVLSCSYEANLAPSLAALQSRLSLSEPELKKVVLRLPSVLSFSYEANIAPSLAALQSRLSLSEPELKKVVLGIPPVLGCSFESNIGPTLAFMETAFRLAPDELRERVVATPALLSLSLDRRYHPRVALASAPGVVVARETLRPAAMYTDPNFMVWLRKREQLGLADGNGRPCACCLSSSVQVVCTTGAGDMRCTEERGQPRRVGVNPIYSG